MEEHEMNYRIVKTKHDLKDALISLLAKYDFDHINVSMICTKAGITRATFYKYYSDKYVLADEALTDLASSLNQVYIELIETETLNNEEKSKFFIRSVLKYVVDARKIILSLNQNEGNSLISYIITHRFNLYLTSAIKVYKRHADFPYPSNLAAAAVSGSLTSLIIEWLNHPSGVSEEKLVDIIYMILEKTFDKDVIFDPNGKQ